MAATPKARVHVASNGMVHVNVSAEVLYNLEATQQLAKQVLGRLGCPTCCSGRQIIFQQEEIEFNV